MTATRLRSLLAGTQTSSALLSLAALPMAVIFVLVIAMFWVSVQKGALGTPGAIYTLANYREVFADPFIIGVAVNTLIFTITATLVALLFGLPVAWLVERTTLPGNGTASPRTLAVTSRPEPRTSRRTAASCPK